VAIYHFHVNPNISRGKGQSVIASAAYRAREKLTNERTGEIKDFSRKHGDVLFSGLFAPKDAPAWARYREKLWNEVERVEKRKDAQLARDFDVALPHELTLEQNRYLLQDFIKENFTRKGYVVDLSIHKPDGDERNIHAHLLVTLRKMTPDGFARTKSEEQDNYRNRSAYTEALRESWERHVNRHLERHGQQARIDRRTLAAQGIEREPTQHLGPNVAAMAKKGIETDRGAQLAAILERNELRFDLAKARRELADLDRDIARAMARAWNRGEGPRLPSRFQRHAGRGADVAGKTAHAATRAVSAVADKVADIAEGLLGFAVGATPLEPPRGPERAERQAEPSLPTPDTDAKRQRIEALRRQFERSRQETELEPERGRERER
jgi:hypothetical protein